MEDIGFYEGINKSEIILKEVIALACSQTKNVPVTSVCKVVGTNYCSRPQTKKTNTGSQLTVVFHDFAKLSIVERRQEKI